MRTINLPIARSGPDGYRDFEIQEWPGFLEFFNSMNSGSDNSQYNQRNHFIKKISGPATNDNNFAANISTNPLKINPNKNNRRKI